MYINIRWPNNGQTADNCMKDGSISCDCSFYKYALIHICGNNF